MRILITNLMSFAVITLLLGCEKADSSVISEGTNTPKKHLEEMNSIDKNSYAEVADVFLETQNITTQDKPYFLVFGANGCLYCERLKTLIKQDLQIKETLQTSFSPYYINLSYSKKHNVDFLNKELSTAKLGQIYGVRSTPTLVFLNANGDTLLVYPGYMQKERFMTTLEFLKNPDIAKLDEKTIAMRLRDLFEQKKI
ncbi:SoxW family protein [Helicobacter mesocricetorum]|uniref:SoxW family protein n=1 Tax=Helicobacter mesocricetorum TaxID=87012 RepID=UPI0018F7F07E|nr:thioredoxin family protein [Helicobacter mesocricetorum]